MPDVILCPFSAIIVFICYLQLLYPLFLTFLGRPSHPNIAKAGRSPPIGPLSHFPSNKNNENTALLRYTPYNETTVLQLIKYIYFIAMSVIRQYY